jgi:hypothetical protein
MPEDRGVDGDTAAVQRESVDQECLTFNAPPTFARQATRRRWTFEAAIPAPDGLVPSRALPYPNVARSA